MGVFFRLVLCGALFGAGFYTGVRFAEHQYVKDPSKLGKLVKKSVKEKAQQQLEKAKELLEK